MQVFTHTEPGGHATNEDYLLVRKHPGGNDRHVCILADGQGGQSHGAEAARTACETAWALVLESKFERLMQADAWNCILEKADHAAMKTGGFTTLVALALDREGVCGASCGDSKVYFQAPYHKMDELTLRQRRNPPVGSGDAFFEPFTLDALAGGRLLVVSDGVWKYCGYESLQAALRLPDFSMIATFLRSAATNRSGPSLPDDFSLIAIEIE